MRAYWDCGCGHRVDVLAHWCEACGDRKPMEKKAGVELSQKVLGLGKELDKTRREREELRAGVEFAEKRISRQKEQLKTAWGKLRVLDVTSVMAQRAEIQNMGQEMASLRTEKNAVEEWNERQRRMILDFHALEARLREEIHHAKHEANRSNQTIYALGSMGYNKLQRIIKGLSTPTLIRLAQAVHGRIYKRLEA